MITYIDSNNKQDYTVLFNKASAKLGLTPIVKETTDTDGNVTREYYRRVQQGGEWTEVKLDETKDLDAEGNILVDGKPSHGISSLNEYFQHITDLASLAIGNGRSGSDPYFLRLPVDEPYLEINANTRAITVPAALNQIGVIGDKYAEIVFFRIDRYYDAIDLDTRHIYIEWELPDGTKGVSRDFLKDTQSEKDKIIFGWVIGDELTKQTGIIRFAVRFVEWNHDQTADADKAVEGTDLAYSFSSLPAQINIVDSLHYSLFEDDEEAQMIDTLGEGSTIKFYLENSTPDGTDETAPELADIPVFVRNLDGTATQVAGTYEKDLTNNELELMVEAASPDSGNISYMFGKKDTPDGGTKGIVAKIKFLPVELTKDTINDNITYYKKKANDAYEIVINSSIKTELSTEDKATYYERVAYIIAAGPGYYFAQARNNVSGKKTSNANSNIIHVPAASVPVVDTVAPERFVLGAVDYELEADTSIDQSLRANVQASNIKVVSKGEKGASSITLGAGEVGPLVSAEKTNGLTYTWYKATKADMSDKVAIEGADQSSYTVTEPGYYAVNVDNFYNNSHTALAAGGAGVTRVTNMPTISVENIKFDDWAKAISAGSVQDIEVDEMEHDHLLYTWHKVTTADSADMDPVAEDDMAKASGELTFTDGVAKIPFSPLRPGAYYLILENDLNDKKYFFNTALEPTMGVIVVSTNDNA